MKSLEKKYAILMYGKSQRDYSLPEGEVYRVFNALHKEFSEIIQNRNRRNTIYIELMKQIDHHSQNGPLPEMLKALEEMRERFEAEDAADDKRLEELLKDPYVLRGSIVASAVGILDEDIYYNTLDDNDGLIADDDELPF